MGCQQSSSVDKNNIPSNVITTKKRTVENLEQENNNASSVLGGTKGGNQKDFTQAHAHPTSITNANYNNVAKNSLDHDGHPKPEISIKSAILIQRWYRRYLARLEARRRYTWKIFQSLEYEGENDQLKLYQFFKDVLEQEPLLQTYSKSTGNPFTDTIRQKLGQKYPPFTENETDFEISTNPESCPVEKSYKGPHVTFPLTLIDVKKLIDAFKHDKVLHAHYVLKILHIARNLLKSYPNIRLAETSISNKVTVCGDFHGKLEDILVVFNKNGFPSSQNPYVFNGDYVDRGKHSIEVVLLMMCYFILYPDSVYLNRGNHEDCLVNLRYGFQKEIITKYQQDSGKLITAFSDFFGWIPFGTVINDKIFVCHGGVSKETDLNYIQTIDRSKYISLLKPISNATALMNNPSHGNKTVEERNSLEWKQLIDILWNDPMNRPGQIFNYIRGGGEMFGPDVTKAFLDKHNFSLLIRSHECKPKGYEFSHDNKLLTIFSASNYYELGSNNGAFVQIDSELNLHFVEYVSSENIFKYSMNQRLSLFEESAMRNLKTLLFSNRTTLLNEFEKFDVDNKGVIPISKWCQVLENTLRLNLPWRIMCKNIVKMDENNMVIYKSMFDNTNLSSTKLDGIPMMEAIYRNKINLENIFRLMDTDNSGLISQDEFASACKFLGEHAHINLTEPDVKVLAKSLDLNNDGYIDLNEFLEAFRLVNEPVDLSPK